MLPISTRNATLASLMIALGLTMSACSKHESAESKPTKKLLRSKVKSLVQTIPCQWLHSLLHLYHRQPPQPLPPRRQQPLPQFLLMQVKNCLVVYVPLVTQQA